MTTRKRGTEFGELEVAASEKSIEVLQMYADAEAQCAEDVERLKSDTGSPDYARALKRLENAKLQKEIFLWEHDSTGALKGDRFGRDMNERLLQTEGKEQKGTMFIVNMGELDRFNDVSHKLGDQALTELRIRISRELNETMSDAKSEGSVDVYRMGSNDFAITINGMDDPSVVARVKESLESRSFDPNEERGLRGESDIPEARGVEGLPLAVTEPVSFAKVQQIFDSLPKEPAPTNEADLDTWEQKQRTDWIDCAKEITQVFSDFEKTQRRTERLAEKIRSNDPGAEELYTKYLQKTVSGLFRKPGDTASRDFSAFKKDLFDQGAEDPKDPDWESALFTASLGDAMKQFYGRSGEKVALIEAIATQARNEFSKRAEVLQQQIAVDLRTAFEQTPVANERTSEVRAEGLKEFDAQLGSREAGFGPTDGEIKIGRIKDGLKDVEQRIQIAGGVEKAGEDLKLEKENLELQQRLFLAQHDPKTGLGLRGKYFESLKGRIEQGEPVSVIAMDMAFLKYFDRIGGSKTGDRAILAAGRILDEVAREMRQKHPELPFDAFRKGGDEFNMVVGSADPKVIEEVRRIIRLRTDDLGAIPADVGGAGGYFPTNIQFNVGVSSIEKPQQEKRVDVVADELDHAADGGIGPDKSVNRYADLVLKRLRAEAVQDPIERKKRLLYVKDLTGFSEKALLAGSAPIEQLTQRLLENADEILTSGKPAEEVAKEIVELVQRELEKKDAAKEALSAAAVEAFAHQLEVALLQIHVEKLIKDLQTEREQNEELQRTVRDLRKAVADAMADKENVAALRERIAASKK